MPAPRKSITGSGAPVASWRAAISLLPEQRLRAKKDTLLALIA